MVTGSIVIERFGYAVNDVMFDMHDLQTGAPTGEKKLMKVLGIQTIDSQDAASVVVEIRMTPEDFDVFVKKLATPQVQVATAHELELLRRNGPGYSPR